MYLPPPEDEIEYDEENSLWTMAKNAVYNGLIYEMNRLVEGAAETGNLTVVKFLVERGANISQEALSLAASNGHLSVVKYLVSKGTDIHTNDEIALFLAVRNDHEDVVKYLIKQGAQVDLRGDDILVAPIENGNIDLFKLLVKHFSLKRHGEYALKKAIEYEQPEIIEYLIEEGVDISKIDVTQITNPEIRGLIEKSRKRQFFKESIIKVGKTSIREKKLKSRKQVSHIASWQRLCRVVSSKTNMNELQKISLSVGLPTIQETRALSKVELCGQLARQMEAVLQNTISYNHTDYCDNIEEYQDLFDTDLNQVSKECLIRDEQKRCYYIGDIVDRDGNLKENMHRNPYTRQPWPESDGELVNKRKTCAPLRKVHQINPETDEDLQKQIVRDVLIKLDELNRTSNTDILMQADFTLLNNLVEFFQNRVLGTDEYKRYSDTELKTIKNNHFEIDMLARFLSITSGKISDDVVFGTYLDQFLKDDY